jgi:general secretion pathway protein H
MHSRPKALGFTLLELLVVLVVIGIAAGLVTVKAMPDDKRLLTVEAERLSQLFFIAQEDASLRSKRLAWQASDTGFGFYELMEDGAKAITSEDLLRTRKWGVPGVKTRIFVDGSERRRLEFLPQPGTQSVTIRLQKDTAQVQLNRSLGGRYNIVQAAVQP